ncbi:MAG TPA: GDYXXLXY domain-containing protein [Phenylobacterium sp.]|nr:GDYXXLXY domain-containing protein [Phenylobacterium sp.]HQN52117.1 GDYXXLXY domain-containing protein [Phenylobacterium sp.]
MSYPVRIGAVALLLVALLVGLVVRETAARTQGTELRLTMQALDPRDLLTGHYAALDFGQALPLGAACPTGLGPEDKPGWIAFTPGPVSARVTGFAADRASAARLGPIVAKGKASCWRDTSDLKGPGRVALDLGVRRFHADQKRAEAVEAALRGREPGAAIGVLSVGKDGKPRLKGVIIAGQRMDLDWK